MFSVFAAFFFFSPLEELLFISYGAKLFLILFIFLQRDPFLNLITLRSRVMGCLGKSRLEIVFLGHVMGAGAGGAPVKGESWCSPSKGQVFSPHPAKSAFSAPKHHCSSSHGSFSLGFNTQRWGSGACSVLGSPGETLGLKPRCKPGICWVWVLDGTQTSLLLSSSEIAQGMWEGTGWEHDWFGLCSCQSLPQLVTASPSRLIRVLPGTLSGSAG